MSAVQIHLVGGETIVVSGTVEEVEKALSDAARSGGTRMAGLTATDDGVRIGINPAQVTMLREAPG